jgi:replication-associated recombination protein RarA
MELFPDGTYQSREAAGSLADAPLAERMRPQRLQDFQGQAHLLGPVRASRWPRSSSVRGVCPR